MLTITGFDRLILTVAEIPASIGFCFTVPGCEHVCAREKEITAGPVQRTGVTSPLLPFYLRDPDPNLSEIANVLSDS